MDFSGPPAPTLFSKKLGFVYKDYNVVFWLYRCASDTLFWYITRIFVPMFYFFDFAQMKCMRGPGCGNCEDKIFALYCWTQGTHVVLRHMNGTEGRDVPHVGMGKIESYDQVEYQWAYMWFVPYLFIVHFSFLAPWWIWKIYFDSYKLLRLCRETMPAFDSKTKDEWAKKNAEKSKRIADYFRVSLNGHNTNAVRYMACEIFNFMTVLLHMFSTNWLLKGQFSSYGWDVITYFNQADPKHISPMARIFPKTTTCHLDLIGPAGSSVLHEGICVLPLNTLLDKLFLLLWFWFGFLAIASTFGLIFRALTLAIPEFRYRLFSYYNLEPRTARIICNNTSYGDWFIIFSFLNSVPTFTWVFHDAMAELAITLNGKISSDIESGEIEEKSVPIAEITEKKLPSPDTPETQVRARNPVQYFESVSSNGTVTLVQKM